MVKPDATPLKTLGQYEEEGASPKNVALVRLLQPLNTAFSIEVTLPGIVTLVKLLQPSNAELPIEVTPSSKTTLVIDVRCAYHGA